jgi:hypothetical protein
MTRTLTRLLPALVLLTGGCVTMDMPDWMPGKSPPPVGKPLRVVGFWEPRVEFAPDTSNNGKPQPGLVGRVYLLGKDDLPITAEGTLAVELYDVTGLAELPIEQQVPRPMLRNVYLPDNLRVLANRNAVGWGYTVWFPWTDCYSPAINRVQMVVRFYPANGAPMISTTPTLVTLAQSNGKALAGSGTQTTVVGKPKN